MKIDIHLHFKNDDLIEATKLENEDGEFIVLNIGRLTFYFEGYNQEGYENACAYLDNMKKKIQNAWKRKGE